MNPGISCAQVIDRLTDLQEGALPLAQSIRIRLHLMRCPDCRELRAELRRVPELIRSVAAPADEALLGLAQAALRNAQERIREFRPARRPLPTTLPSDLQALLQTGADLPLRIMELVHRAFVDGTAPLQAPFLPASAAALLPPAEAWVWQQRGHARVTTLVDEGPNGAKLNLLVAPRGFRTPSHLHFGSEQMLVLEGLLEDGEQAYATGTWVNFGKDSIHAPEVLNDECWCLIREEGAIRYTGPLGWLRNLLAA